MRLRSSEVSWPCKPACASIEACVTRPVNKRVVRRGSACGVLRLEARAVKRAELFGLARRRRHTQPHHQRGVVPASAA